MRWIFRLLVLFAVGAESFAAELYLAPGKSVFLPAKENLTVEVEDSQVVAVKDLGDRVQLIGRRTGETDVLVGQAKYRLQVVTKSLFQTYSTLAGHFRSTGLAVEYRKSKLFLTGKLRSVEDWRRLWRLPPLSDKWILAAQIPKKLRPAVQQDFARLLREVKLPPASLVFHPSATALISPEYLAYKKLYELALNPYGIAVAEHPGSLYGGELLRVQIVIAEVKKGYLQKFGLRWPGQLRAQIVPKFLWEEGDEASLLQVNLLESRGIGHVLAAPNLLCQSGHEAEFMAGGEIPIPTSFGHDIIWKKHGILLKIKPELSPNGPMQIQLTTEISSLDYASAINGVPGLASNRLATVFSLTEEQPIVLSGLIKKDLGRQVDGLPWLGRIPIIGPLFSSRTFQNNETELVIVVLPQRVHPQNISVENSHG